MFVREENFVVTKLPLTGIVPSFGGRSAGTSCGLQWSQPDLQSLGFQTLTVRVSSRFSEQDHPKAEIWPREGSCGQAKKIRPRKIGQ